MPTRQRICIVINSVWLLNTRGNQRNKSSQFGCSLGYSPFILPTQQRINQPLAGFCFLGKYVEICIYCYNLIKIMIRNVGIELAT
jgi:hypothetical protein